jgi:hypothetical protein
MTTRKLLAEVIEGLDADWYKYDKKVMSGADSEIHQWSGIGQIISRTAVWLREAMGYDVVQEGEDGKKTTVHHPCYGLLLASGKLERSLPRRLGHYRVPPRTLVTMEVIDAETQDGMATEDRGD